MLPQYRTKILFCVGLFLLAAAALKLSGPGPETVERVGLFSLQLVQVVIVILEIGVALWLCSAAFSSLSWCTTCVLFLGHWPAGETELSHHWQTDL
jgi:hypothetical protein